MKGLIETAEILKEISDEDVTTEQTCENIQQLNEHSENLIDVIEAPLE